jgi:hypothetical protein
MLRLLGKLDRLSTREKQLVLKSAAVVACFRLALFVVPYRRVARWLPMRVPPIPPSGAVSPERIVWAVRVVARRIPQATCLTRALAARWLLAGAGHPATLHYGWRRDEQGRLHAHAWLESGARVLLGDDEDLGRYHPFTPLTP